MRADRLGKSEMRQVIEGSRGRPGRCLREMIESFSRSAEKEDKREESASQKSKCLCQKGKRDGR